MIPCVESAARKKKWIEERKLTGRQQKAVEKWQARNPEKRRETDARWNASGRQRAHKLMVKYGMTLGQAEKMGVIPPDVEEALNGDR